VELITQADAARALEGAYSATTQVVSGIQEPDFGRASRCAGWTVRDVLYHQLLDAQRALIAFSTPSARAPTTDFVEYWTRYKPGMPGAAEHAAFVRRAARAFRTAADLVEWWTETSHAAVNAASHPQRSRIVETQGLAIGVTDLIATLAVEAALHHLDLTLELPGVPTPPNAALRLVRQTLDGLLGIELPLDWDDATYALKGTGRLPLDARESSTRGWHAERFPLLG
jgi:uncharacterized protein (TIGR03083 family)